MAVLCCENTAVNDCLMVTKKIHFPNPFTTPFLTFSIFEKIFYIERFSSKFDTSFFILNILHENQLYQKLPSYLKPDNIR